MKQLFKKNWLAGLLALVLALTLTACGGTQTPQSPQPAEQETAQPAEQTDPAEETQAPEEPPESQESGEAALPEDGAYTTKEDVALYLHLYGHLPDNFITKKEAQKLGWPGGSL